VAIKLFRDTNANAIFVAQGIVGTWPYNCLRAIGNGDGTVSIQNRAKAYPDGSDFFEIVSTAHTEFVDASGTAYGATEAATVNALNAIFADTGGASGNPPAITSSTSIGLTQGETLNYELVATNGVGYEWSGLPSGVTTVEGNVRKLIGGSSLAVGTYTLTAKAVNYFGQDTEEITLTVSAPPFADTKSVNFNSPDWLGANANAIEPVLGRSANGAGSGDAWTISLWYKGSSPNQGQTILYFGNSDVTNQGFFELRQTNHNGQKRLRFRYGSNNNYLQFTTPSGSITAGTWQHVLISYDGGTTGAASGSINSYYSRFKIYIDGALSSTSNSHSNYGWSGSVVGQNFRVGRFSSGTYLRDNARVNELAIWDSDQSGSVADIYNSGATHDLEQLTTAPSYWWRMGDGDTFPTIREVIGDTYHFTMNNMTAADIVTDAP